DWMLAGSNQVIVVKMILDKRVILSIYKPRKGEVPLWDFPDGTLYKREYAAFLVSLEMGWYFIPPTIIRQGPYGIGSMQYMVEIPKGTRNFSDRKIDVSEFKKIVLFDYLVNNADRKISHLLIDRNDRLWIVDHGLTFNAVPKLRTVFWEFAGQKIPDVQLADIKTLRDKMKKGGELRAKLLKLLDKEEIEALDFRIRQILRKAEFPYPTSPWSVPFPWY
ncbi:MAG: hypothetical protein JSU58_08390, partial [Dehalococcoidales bacterium]